jgi:hypothetical protein
VSSNGSIQVRNSKSCRIQMLKAVTIRYEASQRRQILYGGTDGSLATDQFHVGIQNVVTFEFRNQSQSFKSNGKSVVSASLMKTVDISQLLLALSTKLSAPSSWWIDSLGLYR